jgi:hypothetical protein
VRQGRVRVRKPGVAVRLARSVAQDLGSPPADAPREVLKAAPIVSPEALGWRRGREADALQADLKLAKRTWPGLSETTEHTHRLRFHDLRATFETWARRCLVGTSATSTRAPAMAPKRWAQRYDRGARGLAELQEVPFPNLALAIPETRVVLEAVFAHRFPHSEVSGPLACLPESSQVAGIIGCEGGDLNPDALSGASTSSDVATPEESQVGVRTQGNTAVSVLLSAPQTSVCNRVCNEIDADEEALEVKMIAADLAGNTTLAKACARRLERLRAGKTAGNVRSIDSARYKR